MDNMKRIIDKILKEVEFKSSFKDLESHITYTKNCFEELHKELMLRAPIKDVCTLLD